MDIDAYAYGYAYAYAYGYMHMEKNVEHGEEDETRGEPSKKRHGETELLDQSTPKKPIKARVKDCIKKVLLNASLCIYLIQEIYRGYI